MLDLIELWKNIKSQTKNPSHTGEEVYPDSTKQVAIEFEKRTLQSSFEFNASPDVKFVSNLSNLTPTNRYDDLTTLELSAEEEAVRQTVIKEQKAKNPKFYDGEQMLIVGAAYEVDINTVFFVAKKVPYSTIVCLSQKKFPETSSLYKLSLFKTGVLAPLVTNDGQTFLLQRKADTLFSVPAGFLEPQGDKRQLNLDGGDNVVCATARAEIKEELAGINGEKTLRFSFSNPQISAVSFRSSAGPIGTIEFVAPSYANCDNSFLRQVVENNCAEDADEHTGKHMIVPLDSSQRDTLLSLILSGTIKIPGSALYLAVLLSLTRIFNQPSMIELPGKVPGSSSLAYPIRLFHPEIPRLMLTSNEDCQNDDIPKPK